MKKKLFFLALLFLSNDMISQNSAFERIYTQVEVMPSAPSCSQTLENMYQIDKCTKKFVQSFFEAHLEYPEKAFQNFREGVIQLNIIVDTTGQLNSPTILQKINTEIDDEALRIINLLMKDGGNWQVGKQGKIKVNTKLVFEFDFSITKWNEIKKTRLRLLQSSQDSLNRNDQIQKDSIQTREKP